ncbi:hypothetical protein CISIN_1g047743mg, partial [Citrus sinensis]
TKNQVQGRLLLDVIIGECAPILKLFTSKDKPLLIWWNPFLVLDLSFDIINGIGAFNLKGYGFSSESLHKDLHLLDKKNTTSVYIHTEQPNETSKTKYYTCTLYLRFKRGKYITTSSITNNTELKKMPSLHNSKTLYASHQCAGFSEQKLTINGQR